MSKRSKPAVPNPASLNPERNLGSSDGNSELRRKRRVNGRFLLVLIVVAVTISGATYGLHSVQMKRNASSLLELANEATENGDRTTAIEYLQQYLRFRPTDYDAKVQYSELLAGTSQSFRNRRHVLGILEDVLSNDPDRDDANTIRRRAVDLALTVGRPRDALAHISILQQKQPRDAELFNLEGKCHFALGEREDAVDDLLKAIIASELATIQPYVNLAAVLDQHPEVMPSQEEVQHLEDQLSDKEDLPSEDDRISRDSGKDDRISDIFPRRDVEKKDENTEPEEPEKTKSTEDIIDELYARLVKHGRPEHLALIARARFYVSGDKFQSAEEDVNDALSLAEKNPEATNVEKADVLEQAAQLQMTRAGEDSQNYQRDEAIRRIKEAAKYVATGRILEGGSNLRFYALSADVELRLAGQETTRDARIPHYENAEQDLDAGIKALNRAKEAAESEDYEQTAKWLRINIRLASLRAEVLLNQIQQSDGGVDSDVQAEFQQAIKTLNDLGAPDARLTYFVARELLIQHKWWQAVVALNSARKTLISSTPIRRQIDLDLARCYGQLRNTTAQIQTLEAGIQEDSLWHRGRLMLAGLLLRQNRTDDAANHYEIMNRKGVPLAAIEIVRQQIRRMAALPEEQRNFTVIHENLDKLESSDVFSNLQEQLTVAHVDAFLSETAKPLDERIQSSIVLLDRAIGDNALEADAQLVIVRARLEAQRPGIDKETRLKSAIAMLSVGQDAALMAAQPQIAIQFEAKTAARQLKDIARNALKLELKSDQAVVLEAVARGYATLKLSAESRDTWLRVSGLLPEYLAARIASASLALSSGKPKDLEAMKEQHIPAMQLIEGEMILGADGKKLIPNPDHRVSVWGVYYSALRLMALAVGEENTKKQEKNLDDARRLLQQGARQQPQWPQFPNRLGRVAVMLGGAKPDYRNAKAAYDSYRLAINLGDRGSETYVYCVRFLLEERRFEEAEYLLKLAKTANARLFSGSMNLDDQTTTLPELSVQLALNRRDFAGVRSELSDGSAGYRRHIFLGNLDASEYLSLSKDQRETVKGLNLEVDALDHFTEALKLKKESPEPWMYLVSFYSRAERPDDVIETIEKAKEQLPAELQNVTAARCYGLIGNQKKAEQEFKLAVKSHRKSAFVRLSIARFYASLGNAPEALSHIQFLLDDRIETTAPQKKEARRLRILTMASRGKYAELMQAIELLDKIGKSDVAELELRAALLRRSPARRDQKELIKVLEQIRKVSRLSPDDRFLLAQLYWSDGSDDSWNKGEKLMNALLENESRNPRLLAIYAVALTKKKSPAQGDRRNARSRLRQLQSVEPDSLRTAEVKTRVLCFEAADADKSTEEAKKDRIEAAKIIEDAVAGLIPDQGKPDKTALVQVAQASKLCEELDLDDAAERLIRWYAELSDSAQLSDSKDAPLQVAVFLGRQAKFSEALKICYDSREEASPGAAAVAAVNIVSVGEPTSADLQLAAKLIEEARKADPESAAIKVAYAGLLTSLGKSAEAETVYWELLAAYPKSAAIANNLAWLLAMTNKKNAGALKLINAAIVSSGPVGEILDTKGIVLLRQGKTSEAIKTLKDATNEKPDDAIFHFHLAQAYLKNGDRTAAKKILETANGLGLNTDQLHRLDQPGYRKALQATGLSGDG